MSNPSLVVEDEYVTQGQAALANGCAQQLCEHTYMAMLGPEGEPSREEHIAKARDELTRCARLLGGKAVFE